MKISPGVPAPAPMVGCVFCVQEDPGKAGTLPALEALVMGNYIICHKHWDEKLPRFAKEVYKGQ